MRTKFKFWAVEYLKNNPSNQFLLDNFDEEKFINFIKEKETYLEIGPGKGRFITNLALKYPNYNFIVIELNSTISGMCLKSIDELKLNNVKLICGNFLKLVPYLNEVKLSGLFLNFSDPWPKKRHEKRRLTSDIFLREYSKILKEDALIYLKSDNLDFFNYSVEQFKKFKYQIISLTNDYQMLDEFDEETEFENKFKSQNVKINRMILKNTKETIEWGEKYELWNISQ